MTAVSITGDSKSVERMLMRLDTVLSPVAIAGFLGATVSPYLRGRAQARFTGEGDDVVGAWLPLSEATQEIRESMGYGAAHPINKRTGELEAYITQSAYSIMVDPLGAVLTMPGNQPTGELADKVKTAQQGKRGSKNSWGDTDPRPVLGMNSNDTLFVLGALVTYVEKGMNL